MTLQEMVPLYLSLFAGRPDVYAIRREWQADGETRSAYMPSTYNDPDPKKEFAVEQITRVTTEIGSREYGPQAVAAHLMGQHFLGVYPLHSDSTVRFFALDFDGKDGDDPLLEAVRHQQIFANEAHLWTYIERSRSGNGYHLWGFLDAPVNAGVVRRAILPFVDKTAVFDRMFPNQDGVSDMRPLGNLIALPLYGPAIAEEKGVFIEYRGALKPPAVPNQGQFLKQIARNTAASIHHLAERTPAAAYTPEAAVPRAREPEGLEGAFKLLSPYGCEFFRWAFEHPSEVDEPSWYAIACQCAQLADGRELFHRISAQDTSRYHEKSTDRKFDQALRQNKPHTCAWIRENLPRSPGCRCDERFPDLVSHPYDLVKVPVSELVDDAEAAPTLHSMVEGICEAVVWAQQVEEDPSRFAGFPYGYAPVDERTSLRAGDLIIIGARPSVGKSAIGNDITFNLAVNHGIPCFQASMEMSKDQQWRRFLARAAEVDHGRILTGTLRPEDWERINAAVAMLRARQVPYVIDDRTRDTSKLLDVVGEWFFRYGQGVILVDYLQLGTFQGSENANEAVTRMAKQYKQIGKILGAPVICLTQLNRAADDATEDSETYDSWLRQSGELEQVADVIMYLLGKKTEERVAPRVLVGHKERSRGGGWRVPLQFNQPIMKFAPAGTWQRDVDLNALSGAHGLSGRVLPPIIEFAGQYDV